MKQEQLSKIEALALSRDHTIYYNRYYPHNFETSAYFLGKIQAVQRYGEDNPVINVQLDRKRYILSIAHYIKVTAKGAILANHKEKRYRWEDGKGQIEQRYDEIAEHVRIRTIQESEDQMLYNLKYAKSLIKGE